jgi:chromate transporter
MTSENFGSPEQDLRQFLISVVIFLAAFVATRKYKVNPILMIMICGIAGGLLYM